MTICYRSRLWYAMKPATLIGIATASGGGMDSGRERTAAATTLASERRTG